MKNFYLLCCSILLAFTIHAQDALPKLSPLTMAYLDAIKQHGDDFIVEKVAYKKHSNNQLYVAALIKVANAGSVQEKLSNIGATIGTKAGNIWTVHVPVSAVRTFTSIAGIEYIQLDEPVFPNLDVARRTTRVDSVQKGYNLPMPYSGKDVVVGVIDFGFDYNHPTFYDTLGATYRIKRVWELNSNGTPPAGYAYGKELTTTSAIQASGTDNTAQTHGTATAGMAAGSGYGSTPAPDRFRGMAYNADLVMVGVRRDSIGQQWLSGSFSDFIDGINYIFTYAASVSKPAVVNISWGSQSGPHEGTTLFNQACNNLSGAGKLIVMSAGNEGKENIHLSKTFSPTDTNLSSFVLFNPPIYKRTWIDIWGESGKTFCAKVFLFNTTSQADTQYICLGNGITNTYLLDANNTDSCLVQFMMTTSDFNGKPHMTINMYNKTSQDMGFTISSTSGTVHLWDEYYFFGYDYKFQSFLNRKSQPWATNGNTTSTTSDMGSAQSVLLVGAYASKVLFTDINGNTQSYASYVDSGKIAPFSSHGPMIDGRIKPDIAAPGITVATSMSSYDTSFTPTGSESNLTIAPVTHLGKTYYYAEFTGTSASSPAAAGITALLLQANPNLTPQQLKDVLSTTAITDNLTGAIPSAGNNIWGHGRINAYGAIKKVIQQLSVYEFNGRKLDCVLFPNPGNGNFLLDYEGAKNEQLSITAYDVAGKKIATEKWQVHQGNNRRELNYTQLSSGVYFLNVAANDGQLNIKFVIN